MKILLTGANGFVGNAVWQTLERDGCNVRPAFRSASARDLAGARDGVVTAGLAAATDWSAALAGVGLVVHCAARVHVMRDTAADPLAEFRAINVAGTLKLARQAAVHEVMADLGLDQVAVVGVAKGIDRDQGKEEFHRTGARPFSLRMNDPVLYFVQRLRDEAHRFVIGAHRARRSKAISASPLDEIPGVGAGRKRALLAHFGSAKAVARAGLTDLRAVDGISDAMAETIYGFFHEKG